MNFFELLFPDFSLIVIGWLVCRYTALGRDVWQRVDGLVYYFLFPVLLFQAIVRKPLDLQATSSMIAAGLTPDQPIFFLCRSGVRSLAAAKTLTALGYKHCYNITGGFEGDVDANKHRGMLAGWKFAGLPWTQ